MLTLTSVLPRNHEADSENDTLLSLMQGKDQSDALFGKRRLAPEDSATQIRLGSQYINELFDSRSLQESYVPGWALVDQNTAKINQLRVQVSDRESLFNLSANPESSMHLSSSSNMMQHSKQLSVGEIDELRNLNPANSRCDGMHGLEVKRQRGNWLFPLLHTSNAEKSNHPTILNMENLPRQQDLVAKETGKCKLFGISLLSNPVMAGVGPQGSTDAASEHHQDTGSQKLLERLKISKFSESATGRVEMGKRFQVLKPFSRDGRVNLQGGSTSSCIKVFLLSCWLCSF